MDSYQKIDRYFANIIVLKMDSQLLYRHAQVSTIMQLVSTIDTIEPIKTWRVSNINILAKLVKSRVKSINYEQLGKYYHHSR